MAIKLGNRVGLRNVRATVYLPTSTMVEVNPLADPGCSSRSR